MAKKAFIDAYQKTYGNISEACKAVGISRGTYYNWKAADEEFAKTLSELEPEEVFVDLLENKLVEKINQGDTIALIFALKTKGKKRGYVEKQQIEHSGQARVIMTDENGPISQQDTDI